MNNRLYYGDNLDILRNREYFPDECVDLIYLDPPFNSNRNYNVLFKSESGADSEAQITAFEDTWHWGETAEATYDDLIVYAPHKVSVAIKALMNLIERNQMMAYLVMMTARLVELASGFEADGSLYLHCDPTASHYLKADRTTRFLAGRILEVRSFGNGRQHTMMRKAVAGKIHDVILIYSSNSEWCWNVSYYDQFMTHTSGRVSAIRIHSDDDEGRLYELEPLTGGKYQAAGRRYQEFGTTA